MAELERVVILDIPATRIIGIKVINGGGENPVPALWERCFQENVFQALAPWEPVIDYWVGWMGEFQNETGIWTYIAGQLMPAGTPVPEGFEARDLPCCTIANGFIHGSFTDGDVFRHSHEFTVSGMVELGFVPDYSCGWSAEAYAKTLSFEAQEGTINYLCPCRKAEKQL